MVRFSSFILLALLFFSCARQEPPRGGPEDTTFPQILDHLPRSLATKVSLQRRLKVFFSEQMDRKSVEESIFISPPLSHKACWKGQLLTLTPATNLSPNCTYVVTLGTGCRDLHGNPLSQAYTFAFSTGDSIDQGSIDGRTFFQGEPIEGASIWAYRSLGGANPLAAPPDYVTQSGIDGHFQFGYLAAGNYLIFALLDKNRDGKWDPASEPLAVPPKRVDLTTGIGSVKGLYLSLALRDTTPPNLISLQPMDRGKLRLVFDHPMDSLQIFNPSHYFLSFAGGKLPIKGIYPDYGKMDRVYLWTDRQEEGKRYTLRMKGIGDRWGNALSLSSVEVNFSGSSLPDTVPPSLQWMSPPDGAKAVPLGTRVKLFFSEPMDQPSVEKGFGLLDMEGDTISGNFNWPFPNLCCYIPEERLPGSSSLQIILEGDRAKDLAGNRLSDSTLAYGFSTLNPDTLGSLSGKITLADTTQKGMVVLSCKCVDSQIGYVKPLKEPGPYTLESLICGRYILRAWLDRNFNHRFDQGKLSPFFPAEFFTVYPDTVRVRARWETEGIDMELGVKR